MFLFLVSPLVAVISGLAVGWPGVLVSGAILVLSGYRIWRIDHPGESARYELGWRVKALLTAAAGVFALLAFEVAGVWVVAALIVVGLVYVVVSMVADLRRRRSAPAIPEVRPTTAQDDRRRDG